MASDHVITTTTSTKARPATGPLAQLRKAAGYRSAREFAATLGIPSTTYSRWERSAGDPSAPIPLHAAWAMADRLGCTIDAVVGRTTEDPDRDLNAEYAALSESGRERLDEYLQFLGFRDRMIASEGR